MKNRFKIGRNQSIIIFVLLLTTTLGVAQNDFENPDLLLKPQTPETAYLGKYISLPISLNTGTPQISIPIYTIEYGGMKVPITLSYDASGIKVEDLASNVGLKWSLNVGGSVSRIVKGTYDEGNHYAVPQNGIVETRGYYQNYGLKDLSALKSLSPIQAGQTIGPFSQDVATGQLDTQPDLFSFSGLGNLGKFFFDENRTPILHDANDYKIRETYTTSVRPRFTKWTITGSNGLKMTYGNQENAIEKSCTTNFGVNPTNWQDNAWYMSRIDNPATNRSISFEYIENTYRSAIVSSRTFQFCFTYNGSGASGCAYGENPINAYDQAMEQFINTSSNEARVTTQLNYRSPVIKKIIAGDTEILFNTSNRTDVFNIGATPQKIDEIIVTHKGNCVKRFKLNHSYFVSGTEPIETNIYGDTTDPSSKRRLKLVSLDEISCTTGEKKTHEFFYDETNALPPRLSFAKDKWGYYNGENNNGSLYPEKNEPFSKSGDRKVYPEYTKAGTLNKIVYPTKGSVMFDYEVHKNDTRTFTREGWVIQTGRDTGSGTPDGETSIVKETNFVMTGSPSKYRVRASLTENTWEYSSPGSCGASTGPAFQIIDPVTNQVKIGYGYSTVGNAINNGRETYIKSLENLTQGKTYKIKVYGYGVSGKASLCYMSSVKIEKFETIPAVESDYYVGGLRVKQVNFLDADGSILKSNRYEYDKATLLFNPKFQYHFDYDISRDLFGWRYYDAFGNEGALADAITEFKRFYSSGKFFLFSTSDPFTLDFAGSHIAYNKVTEITGEGKTQYNYQPPQTYSTASGYQGFEIFPPKPLIQTSLAGKLLSEHYYSEDNTLLKQKFYNYTITFGDFISRGIQISNVILGLPMTHYQLRPDWVRLESETTKDYFKGKEVNTTAQYFYESNKHYMPTKTVLIESGNDERITKSQYPPDLFATSHVLNQQYRINIPIKTENYLKKEGSSTEILQSARLLNYSATPSTSNLALQTSVETSKANTPLEERIRYEKYDSNGNLLQHKRNNGVTTSYIWSYDRMYPVAKIENATFTQLADALGITASDLQNFNETSISSLENLRNHQDLKDAMITTYTYDPLVGMTSLTDPKGYITYYIYDDFNQLKEVRDVNNNLITEYKYYYKN
ncbi:hypothetical protein [Aquimarina algicola]|uniref:RHS repeat protein n=1 Tax=Aquimarina algicola TaxID=2589995 RepID=A0A504JBE9_9FLAO|nr:hypothetical protein [Aquimarina algicola]TPN83890.1 hypothetical protein FHK87_18160 [Aquimarina algicola]